MRQSGRCRDLAIYFNDENHADSGATKIEEKHWLFVKYICQPIFPANKEQLQNLRVFKSYHFEHKATGIPASRPRLIHRIWLLYKINGQVPIHR